MSVNQRRAAGAAAALLVLIVASAYIVWRLRAIGRDGWTGMSYFAVVKVKGAAQPVSGFAPGSVFILYPGGPGEVAGIRRGDRVLAIDGIPLDDDDGIRALANKVRYGSTLVYRVDRGGVLRDLHVRMASPVDVPAFVVLFGVTCAVALIFLAIGLFVFWRRPRDVRAVIFFVMTLCAAATFTNGSLIQVESAISRGIATPESTFNQLAPAFLFGAAGVFFAPLVLHLALVFPKRRPVLSRGRTLWLWIYGYPVLIVLLGGLAFAAMSGLMYLRSQNFRLAGVWFKAAGVVLIIAALTALLRLALSLRRRGWREGLLQRPFASVFSAVSLLLTLAVAAAQFQDKAKLQASLVAILMVAVFTAIASFATYPVATFIALYRSYRESSTEERQQVKWPLWGTMIAVGVRVLLAIFGAALQLLVTFGLYVDIPSLVIMLPEVAGKLFYLLIPLSFAFAILKYRLMNIDVIIRRTVLYSILSAIVFGLYVALVAGIGTLVVNFTAVKSQTMIIGSTIVVGLIAIPLRNRLQQMVDRNLFRERRDFALALRNISSAIGVSDLQVFMQKSAEQLQRAVQNRFVLLALRSESHYVATAKVGIADEILGRLQIPIAELPEIDPESAPALRRLGTSLVLPLRAHSATLGFMALGTRLSDQEFGTDDLQFLAAAAQQIALGIDSARYRTEEADYAQARAMQQILLPTTFPKLDGFGISGMWQPARSVGGDYFDTIALGDGRVAVCIADVAGKGMPAALLMANLQAAVKATAASDVAPEQLCERVKRVVANNLAGGTFITFFYGVIDAATRTFAYCNAGHNPPILVREDGSVERLTTGGPALCRLFRDEPHAGGAVQLGPGDRLVLFTDGASEARRGEEEFGEERLISVIAGNRFLPADALQAAIAGAITGFTGGNLDDDLTLVVVAAE